LVKIQICSHDYNQFFLSANRLYLQFTNISIALIRELSEIEWFKNQTGYFNRNYQLEFAEVRTSRGMGFSFNLIESDKLLEIDE
jgi:hypothetical protein